MTADDVRRLNRLENERARLARWEAGLWVPLLLFLVLLAGFALYLNLAPIGAS